MVLPLKLVSFNTYLISKPFNKQRNIFPVERASAIYGFLQGHDMCFLQEVWGVGLTELTRPSSSDGNDYRPALPSWRYPLGEWTGTLAEVVYTLWFRMLQTGGLYDMVPASVATCVHRSKHTYTQSRSRSAKGVEATLWTNITPWDQRYDLLVLNTHLDPWHPANRQLQVEELEVFLKQTIQQIEIERPQQCWSRTGVLVVGDFNVKANHDDEGSEYHTLFGKRGWNDALSENKEHTYALENEYAVYPDDYGQIDYIFSIPACGTFLFLPLQVAATVEKQSPGKELSDHYPLVANVLPQPSA